jgi:glycosyltransferase involved in cell wall biosynthesis
MPVYNAERYVAAAAESILAQSFADFEFLIVDDGSTDGSRGVLERIAARDRRVRLTSRPNTGYVVALNEMLAAARGEFVARMDADDLALPDRFAAQLAHLRGDHGCLAVGGWADLTDPDGEVIGRWEMPADHESIDRANLRGELRVIHPTLMARRAAVEAAGGYRDDREGSEDLDLMLRLAEAGRLANVPRVVLRYRRHSESYTHARPARVAAAAARTLRDAWHRRGLGEPPAPPPLAPGNRPSPAHDHRTWAWMALGVGNVPAARKHARRAVRLEPLAAASWKAAYCALRGR